MKKKLKFLPLLLFVHGLYAQTTSFEYEDTQLKIIVNEHSKINVIPTGNVSGNIKIDDSFISKKMCNKFKNYMENYFRRHALSDFNFSEFAKDRDLIFSLYMEELNIKEGKPFELYPFGIDLESSEFKKKLMEKLSLNEEETVSINSEISIDNVELKLKNDSDSILSIYPAFVREKLVRMLQESITSEISYESSLKTGKLLVVAKPFEPLCDVLYYGSKLEISYDFKEPERVVEKISVPEKSLNYLYKKLKNNFSEQTNVDAFKAGFLVSKSVNESGFVYPSKLKQRLGKESEMNFYQAFFADNFNWNLEILTERTKRKILGYGYYVRTAPGEEHRILSKLESDTL